MKKVIGLGTVIALAAGVAMAASVSGISENGKSASGKTMYKITCSDGKSLRIYRSDGQWYSAGSGAQGGQSRSLNEQASFLCR
ncbi:MAG TPA: hypothetical protein DD827_11305 [Gammaproteobacteria bacterium]|jgi:hypothetical protein|nr:hypothetical protein [Gammaproteobacteria bacterium]